MCIIVFADKGVALPDMETLGRCWDKNPHGAGIAYLNENKLWSVEKGLMSWKHFRKTLNNLELDDEVSVLIHFRYATAGKKTKDGKPHPGCTHPFIVSNEINDLMKLKYETPIIAAHNGVLQSGLVEMSDSQKWVMRYIYPLRKYVDDDEDIQQLMNILMDADDTAVGYKDNSRWFYADKDSIKLFGKWTLNEDEKYGKGVYYSKDTYKKVPEIKIVSHSTTTKQLPEKQERHYVQEKASYFKNDKGEWDFLKWDSYLNKKNEKKETKEPEHYEIFDDSNVLMGIVDIHGNILWDDEYEKQQEEEAVEPDVGACVMTCPFCSNPLNSEVGMYDLHMCPYCYEDLGDFFKDNEDTPCPHCGNRKETTHDPNDLNRLLYTCLICGCKYDSSKKGYQGVVDFVNDTTIERLREL